jgi:hypothetical protein
LEQLGLNPPKMPQARPLPSYLSAENRIDANRPLKLLGRLFRDARGVFTAMNIGVRGGDENAGDLEEV